VNSKQTRETKIHVNKHYLQNRDVLYRNPCSKMMGNKQTISFYQSKLSRHLKNFQFYSRVILCQKAQTIELTNVTTSNRCWWIFLTLWSRSFWAKWQ